MSAKIAQPQKPVVVRYAGRGVRRQIDVTVVGTIGLRDVTKLVSKKGKRQDHGYMNQ